MIHSVSSSRITSDTLRWSTAALTCAAVHNVSSMRTFRSGVFGMSDQFDAGVAAVDLAADVEPDDGVEVVADLLDDSVTVDRGCALADEVDDPLALGGHLSTPIASY